MDNERAQTVGSGFVQNAGGRVFILIMRWQNE